MKFAMGDQLELAVDTAWTVIVRTETDKQRTVLVRDVVGSHAKGSVTI